MPQARLAHWHDVTGFLAPTCLLMGVWGIVDCSLYFSKYEKGGEYQYCNVAQSLRNYWVTTAVLCTIGFLLAVPAYALHRQIVEGGAVPFRFIAGVKETTRAGIRHAAGAAFALSLSFIMLVLLIMANVIIYAWHDGRMSKTWGVNDILAYNATTQVEVLFFDIIQQEKLADDDNTTIYITNSTSITFTVEEPITRYDLISLPSNPYNKLISWNLTSEDTFLHSQTSRIPGPYDVTCPSCRSFTITPTKIGNIASCGPLLSHAQGLLYAQYAIYGVLVLKIITPRVARVVRSV
eukprot:TRINITY_DN21224_c0_g1_i1.p1 TRINITY_DN21224_c0_g1~~TRINITY_DN21224_c0_g1_i1.p1  ORF type:complete len:293 (+),score=46.16 TRINITY_DN21224_c0_g1_i1:37-915(+)